MAYSDRIIEGRKTDSLLHDISSLTPSDLADYQLAVFALQHEEEYPLYGQQRQVAERVLSSVQKSILVASGDALIKEILPGGGTHAENSIRDSELIASVIHNNDLDRYISSQDDESYERLIENKGYDFDHQSHIKYLGVDAIRIAWGMHCELDRKQFDSSYDFVQVVSDISRLAGAVFQSTIDVLEVAGNHAAAETLKDTWLSFSNITDEVAVDFTDLPSNSQQLIIGFDRLLGASHTGGPIVDRFTVDSCKARDYREVLDIGKLSSLGELALHARVFGNYRYNHQSRT